MDLIKKIIQTLDELPKIVKLILCIPAVAIVWEVYRFCRSLEKNNIIGVVIAVILIACAPFMWLVDLICILLNGKVWWID